MDLLHPAAHAAEPAYRNPGADYRRGDVRDGAVVDDALRGIDHVCHQAAMVGLGTDIGDIADYVAHNDLGTAVLLRALALRGAADAATDPEDAATDPRNVYAATKLHQEHLAQAFARETGVAVTALRYHNVYGPRMPRDTPYSGVAAIFASALAAGRAPAVYEDGGQLRDFVHVRDGARANVLALTLDEPVPGVFNVCSGQPRSVGEMARALHAAHAAAPAADVTGAYRLGDVRHVFADPRRAARCLGFRAREDFAAGMAELARAELREPAAPLR